MTLENDLLKVFNTLEKGFQTWVSDTVKILDNLPNKMTGSVSWDLIHRRMKSQINKWYQLVDDASIETQSILNRHGLDTMPPIIEKKIRSKYEPQLKDLQKQCKKLLDTYKTVVASNLDQDVVDEFLIIAQGVTIDNIINILKDDSDD